MFLCHMWSLKLEMMLLFIFPFPIGIKKFGAETFLILIACENSIADKKSKTQSAFGQIEVFTMLFTSNVCVINIANIRMTDRLK